MSLPNFYHFIAVFAYYDDGISITYPDLPGCVSFGQNEAEAMECAKTSLMLHLYGMEQDEEEIPQPRQLIALNKENPLKENEIFTMIEVFMPSFREKQAKKFVKKTLSIPYWLNAEAEHYNINFSQTLQNALISQLHK